MNNEFSFVTNKTSIKAEILVIAQIAFGNNRVTVS